MRSVLSFVSPAAVLLTCLGLSTATRVSAQQDDGAADVALPIAGTGFAGFGGMVAGAGGTGMFFGTPVLVNPSTPMPGNGGLLIRYDNPSTTPSITVANVETPGTTVGGTIEPLITGYWVWTPATELPPGMYNVTLAVPDGGGSVSTTIATVTVGDPWVPAIPTIDSSPSASWFGQLTASACCQSWIEGFGLDIGNCFSTEQSGVIELSAGLTSPDPLTHTNQFLFRLRAADSPEDSFFWTGWGMFSTISYFTQAEEYCFELDAMDITTGEITTYADTDLEKCAPHGELDDLGAVAIDVADSSLEHFICNSPPVGFEERWCDLNEDACAEAPTAQGCQVYGHVCRGEDLPPINTNFAGFGAGMFGGIGGIGGMGVVAGSGGGVGGIGGRSGGSGGAGGEAGMSDKDDDDDEEVVEEDSGDSGCSVSAVRATHANGAFAVLGALFAAGVSMRVRKRPLRTAPRVRSADSPQR